MSNIPLNLECRWAGNLCCHVIPRHRSWQTRSCRWQNVWRRDTSWLKWSTCRDLCYKWAFPRQPTANRRRRKCHRVGDGAEEVAADLGGDRLGRRRLLHGSGYHHAVVAIGDLAIGPVTTATLTTGKYRCADQRALQKIQVVTYIDFDLRHWCLLIPCRWNIEVRSCNLSRNQCVQGQLIENVVSIVPGPSRFGSFHAHSEYKSAGFGWQDADLRRSWTSEISQTSL